MLYAASVKVSLKKSQRRIDVIVEAPDRSQAEQKALQQARRLYAPARKAVYSIIKIIDETEALSSLAAGPVGSAEPSAEV